MVAPVDLVDQHSATWTRLRQLGGSDGFTTFLNLIAFLEEGLGRFPLLFAMLVFEPGLELSARLTLMLWNVADGALAVPTLLADKDATVLGRIVLLEVTACDLITTFIVPIGQAFALVVVYRILTSDEPAVAYNVSVRWLQWIQDGTY